MTFRGITNDKWQLIPAAVYIFYNFAVSKCDQESVYVTIYLLFFVSCLYKLFYSVNLTNKLPPVCREIIAATEIVDHTNVQADRAYETCKWPGIC